jgi:hypothetical protein
MIRRSLRINKLSLKLKTLKVWTSLSTFQKNITSSTIREEIKHSLIHLTQKVLKEEGISEVEEVV